MADFDRSTQFAVQSTHPSRFDYGAGVFGQMEYGGTIVQFGILDTRGNPFSVRI